MLFETLGSRLSQEKAPRDAAGLKFNWRCEDRSDRQRLDPQRLSQVLLWIATGPRPLIGLLDRTPSALWRQADPDTLQFQPVAARGHGGRVALTGRAPSRPRHNLDTEPLPS
jgi:hypothetical protein